MPLIEHLHNKQKKKKEYDKTMQDAYENETYRKLRNSSVEGYIYRLPRF